MFNDDRGYDILTLKSGVSTKVFTKKEFRIDKKGNIIRQQVATKKRMKQTQVRKKRSAGASKEKAKKRQSIRNYFFVQGSEASGEAARKA